MTTLNQQSLYNDDWNTKFRKSDGESSSSTSSTGKHAEPLSLFLSFNSYKVWSKSLEEKKNNQKAMRMLLFLSVAYLKVNADDMHL